MDIDEFLDKEEGSLTGKEPVEDKKTAEEGQEIEEPVIDEEVSPIIVKGYKGILEEISKCIEKNDLIQAEKLYSKLWLKITEDKFTWQQGMYDDLIHISNRLKGSVNNLQSETTAKIDTIRSLIVGVRKSLKEGKAESALIAYSEMIDVYNKIHSQFSMEKKVIYINEILPLYWELKDRVEKVFSQNFNFELSRINNLIQSTKIALQKHKVEKSAQLYKNCFDGYNALPGGFFLEKIELGAKILELYKEMTIVLEIGDLKSRLRLGMGDAGKRKYSTNIPARSAVVPGRPPLPKIAGAPPLPNNLKRSISPEMPNVAAESASKKNLKGELIKRKIGSLLSKRNKSHIKEGN